VSDPPGTVQAVLLETSEALAPLERELAPDSARLALAELGIRLTPGQVTTIAGPLADVVRDVHDLLQLSSELLTAIEADDTPATIAKTAGTIEKIAGAISGMSGLVGAVQGLGAGIPAATVNAIPERLFNLMLVRALERFAAVNELLELLGVLERERFDEASIDPNAPPFTISTFHFGRLGSWLESPGDVLRDLYGWNDAAFTGVELLRRLGELAAAFNTPVFFDAAAVPPTLDLVVVDVTPKTDVSPKGLAATLRTGFSSGTLTFGADDWRIELQLDFALPPAGVLVVQPTGVTLVPPDPGGTVAGNATLKFVADRTSAADGYIVVGEPGGSRLEVRKVEADLSGSFKSGGAESHGAFGVGAAVSGGKLAIDFDEADGFIGKLLAGVHFESDFAFGLGYSTDHGLYFVGASSLAIQLPLHIDLGPVEISALTLTVGIAGQRFPTALAVDIKAALGPIQAVVEQIGLEVDLALKDDRSGNAGPVDVALGFKPPRGAGLSIDAGLVKGGGYLFFDPDKGEYAGVAELSIAEFVTVKAIGLISTRMPDGSQGFSLLVIISAEFPPIQLGFGFTLNAVGGLLGLNRAVLLDVLRNGVRTGAVNSIMFPTDPVANAPRIISDLKAVFPPHEGTFLVGPMGKLGWGTPSLVTLSLGVIVEIPPGNIAILGVLKVALPDEDVALILLQVNFVGTLEFDKQLLAFDASLYDSHIVFLTLEGDMAVRLKWGDDAGFLLSVGGFHPAFQPPPMNLPTLRRVTISILDYDWARIKTESYFAVTSNTVQFGSKASLFFGVDGCNVSGQLGFDVLFQFSPFYFNALISGSVHLEVIGVDAFSMHLRASLEGPTPYRAKGSGGISFLFFSVDVDFDVTWGDQKDTSLPPIDVLPIFSGEIAKHDNWKALPPPSTNLLVSLRAVDPALAILHPFGALQVSQRALPLALTLDKIGAQKPDDVNVVDITAATSGSFNYPLTPVEELFAPAQFQEMSDADKLSRPSYQSIKGGVVIGAAGGPRSSKVTRRQIAYQVTIIDKEPVRPPGRIGALAGLFEPFLAGAAVTRSPLSFHAKSQLAPYADKVRVGVEGYTIASTRDNTASDGDSTFSSEAVASDVMRRRLEEDPSLEGTIHVLPNHEVVGA
jgi:hypothetical protein